MRPVLVVAFVAATLLALLSIISPVNTLEEINRVDPALAREVVAQLRLPRVLLALGYGATLGITGAALQGLFANPLASPDITGASSGAALGAVLGGYWLGFTQPLALAATGIAGALLALGLLLLLAGRQAETATLLLAGIAISLATGAATSLALALAPSPFAFYDSFEWLMGSLVDRSLTQAAVALVPAFAAAVLLLSRTRAIDLLVLGEDVAATMGIRAERLRLEIIIASSIAVGACVSVCGAVGFVGLVAPVIARSFSAGHPGRALALSGALGASFLLLADLLTRLAPLGRSVPLGVITATVGIPIFLWVLLRMRWRLNP